MAMENRCCDASGTEDCRCDESRWIPVTERLPQEGVEALWCDPTDKIFQFCVAKRDGESLDWGGDLSVRVGRYQYWMPIPSPPAMPDARKRA